MRNRTPPGRESIRRRGEHGEIFGLSVLVQTVVFKRTHPWAWALVDCGLFGLLEMIEILSEFHVIELREKLGGGGSVEPKYTVNNFAFGHSNCLNIPVTLQALTVLCS